MGLFNVLASGSFLPWRWRAKQETDYETILSGLAKEIAEVQTRLTQIRTRERRASVTLTLQAFLVWALYTAACWFFGLLSFSRSEYYDSDDDSEDGAGWRSYNLLLVWIPVVLSPVLIIFTRKIVRFWYRRVGAAEEKHLIELRRHQRDKIDEIKRATKYDHLRMLLEKYDETQPRTAAKPAAPAQGQGKQTKPVPSGAAPSVQKQRQQQQRQQAAGSLTPEQARVQAQRMAAMRQQGSLGPAAIRPLLPAQPMPKTWMDRVADAVLGADPSAAGPEQKYALICSRCHMHNGLALKEEFDEIQYVCPHCGQFNSRRPSSAPHSSPFSSRIINNANGRQSATQTPEAAAAAPPSQRHPLAESSSPLGDKGSPGAAAGHKRAGEGGDDDDDDAPPPAKPLDGYSDDEDEDVPVTSIDTPSKRKGDARLLRTRRRKESNRADDGMEIDG